MYKGYEKFMGEACKKTVINRTCKIIINSSDDCSLFVRAAQENEKILTEDLYLKIEEQDLKEETRDAVESDLSEITADIVRELEVEIPDM